jgi:hypothetical protein
MPKRTREQNFAIHQATQEFIQQGYPTDQAQAIAFRMFRDGELFISKQTISKQTQQRHDSMRTARTLNSIFLLYQLAKKTFK